MYRTITSKQLDDSFIGKTVQVAGWVKVVRDHGGIVFIDLRDHYGYIQLKTYDDSYLHSLTRESVISVTGKVVLRDEKDYDYKDRIGKIEI